MSILGAKQIFWTLSQSYVSPDYVQDGLVTWHDAEWNDGEKTHQSETTAIWKNLASTGSKYDASETCAEWKSKACVFNRASLNVFTIGNNLMRTDLANDYTYEVAFWPTDDFCVWNGNSTYGNSGLVGGHGSGVAIVGGQVDGRGAAFGWQGYDWVVTKAIVSYAFNYICVARSRTQSKVNIWLNGTQIAQSSNAGSKLTTTLPFCIGTSYLATNNRMYDGLIFCVRCYNKALNEEEMLHNYNCDLMRFEKESL